MSESSTSILQEIATRRAQRISREGYGTGMSIPGERKQPLVDFITLKPLNHHPDSPARNTDGNLQSDSLLVAEVKRRSPSKGSISVIPNPGNLAQQYKTSGFRRISVLTEEEYFAGSLADLVAVKQAEPHCAVLRKDFLLNLTDIDISYRAGADAVLLIATLLEKDLLTDMYNKARSLGLHCLVEVHSQNDVNKVRPLKPPLVGINSRDLNTFSIDPLRPLKTRNSIDWPCNIIYESGIHAAPDASFVRGTGFSGFLVGEAVAKDPALASQLIAAWNSREHAEKIYKPWATLYSRHRDKTPLVKICGLTSTTDAHSAAELGCDILGFVLADSPRKADPAVIRSCRSIPLQKSLVITLNADQELPEPAAALLKEGAADFIQFHGDESPDMVQAWPSYKAMSPRTVEDIQNMRKAGSPAVLVDAWSPHARGGTGRSLEHELIDSAIQTSPPLWLAGGLNPGTIGDIVRRWQPDLVDVSSGIESAPGTKDRNAMKTFIQSAKHQEPVP